MDFDELTPDEFEELVYASSFDVVCPRCGYSAVIEPDADYPCPECKRGRLTSPLHELGII